VFAVVNYHLSTVQALLDFGADVNSQANCGCTPLLLAAGNGDIEITRALLARGADPETICNPGRTALVVATERGYSGIVELLKRALFQKTLVDEKSVRSNLQSTIGVGVLAATK
jgi:ankyrin repeat protein